MIDIGIHPEMGAWSAALSSIRALGSVWLYASIHNPDERSDDYGKRCAAIMLRREVEAECKARRDEKAATDRELRHIRCVIGGLRAEHERLVRRRRGVSMLGVSHAIVATWDAAPRFACVERGAVL